jgi:signal transduction histidine kinase
VGRSRALGLGLATAIATVAVAAAGVLRTLELPLRDATMRLFPRRPPERIAAVVIDELALAEIGPWPWPRERLAALVTAARTAGASGVAIDVLLLEPRAGDAVLAAALAALPTVLVASLDERGTAWLWPVPELRAAARVAHGLFELDHDGVLRRAMSTKQADGTALPALAVAAAALADPSAAEPVGRVLVPSFRARPDAVPTVSAAVLLRGDAGEMLSGRVVFIGLTAAGLGDRVVTPVSRGPRPDPGVLVQAALAEAVAAGDLVRPLPPLLAGVPALLLGFALSAAARAGGARRLALEAALIAAPLPAGALLLGLGVAVPSATLSVVMAVVVAALEIRLALLAWRRTGTTAALLAAASGARPSPAGGSLEGRLELLEDLAAAAARRRVDDEEARRVVAHELKTPLTSVRGLSQILRDLDLAPAERRRAADLLVGEADRLQTLIDHLTELERLTRRPLADAGEGVDLSQLIRERAAVLAAGHGRRVLADVERDLRVTGDRRLLERVLENLVGNALKFSPPEAPVEVRAHAAGGEVVVAVRDHGPGIPLAEREAIFRRFARGTAARGREGMGLGLALVREVVTWHGGRVTVAGGEGGGSVFVVTLPARREGAAGGESPGRR